MKFEPTEIEAQSPKGQGAGLRELLPDPLAVWAVLRRNLVLFICVAVLVIGLALAWAAQQTPSYSTKASLLVQPRGETVVNVQSVTPDMPATTDIVDTQVRLVRSPALAARVATIYASRHPKDALVVAGREQLASRLLGMISVARSGSTYLIDIKASSPDPKQAAEVANLFAEEFVAADKEAKGMANANAHTWLRQRAQQLAQEATAAESMLQGYKIRNGLLSANGRSGAENQIANLESEIARADADLAEKRGRLDAARQQLLSGSGGADVGAALGSGTIGELRSREAEASAKVAHLSSIYGDRHPDLLQARSELADLREQIQLEINRILSNLEAEVQVSASRLSSLRVSQGEVTSVLANNNASQVGLEELQRRADAAKSIYETFLNRSRETAAQQGLQQADTRVALLAQAPTVPDYPNWPLTIIFALVGGFGFGVVAVGFAEYVAGGVRTKGDIEQRLRVRYAGAVPMLQSTVRGARVSQPPHEYVISHPFSAFTESFRTLRAFLLLGGGEAVGAPRVLAITSAVPKVGKTTTAICLARTLARAGMRTVLVDCDLRRRGASELLLRDGQGGLYEYLAGALTLDEALVIDEATGLAVLGTAEPQMADDPLMPDSMSRLVAELKRRFDVVIFDTAPILGVADARTVAASADRVLLLARWRKTTISACEASIDILLDAGAKLAGVALTQVDIAQYASTGLTDQYAYQAKFQKYYSNQPIKFPAKRQRG